MTMTCTIRVNGSAHEVAVDGTETLLTVLRDRLLLTGAKRGCNQGVCGACTVSVDGRAVRACLSLAANCDGSEITTVEALDRDEIGDRLQRAFERHGAVQCGFCTPGMLVAARAILIEQPHATAEAIKAGLSGNLCRCSGYRKIIEAVREVAEELCA
jgi:carbon-monoxide dehydrogenase small subunit